MNLDLSALERLVAEKKISERNKGIINIFLLAINDWPKAISDLQEYEFEVSEFINNITSKHEIEKALKKMNLEKNAWEGESLSQILEIFYFYKESLTLKDIIEDFEKELQN